MNLLDENIGRDQWRVLRQRRIACRHIGFDIAHEGIKDEQIVPLLHELGNVTLFTRDRGLFRHDLCHARYSIVVLEVSINESADFIIRVLRHRMTDTRRKRMGRVIRAYDAGFGILEGKKRGEKSYAW